MILKTFRRAAICVIMLATAVSALAQRKFPIADVQGNKNLSSYVGNPIAVSGIVTARTKTGFFLQTPDDKIDKDPNTSEGIFVFTRNEPPEAAAVGNLIEVAGMIEEFKPRSEPNTLTITEISHRLGQDRIAVFEKNLPLPKPIALTTADFMTNSVDQLEKYEGMRVSVEQLVVTGPTDGRIDPKSTVSESNGVFYGVVKGLAKPFREAGLDIFELLFMEDKEKQSLKTKVPKLAIFDGNPERLRIESAALGGKPIEVTGYAEITGLTGVLHYAYRTYAILADPNAAVTVKETLKPLPLPPPSGRQFSVAGMNLENFFDDQDDPSLNEDVVTPEGFARRLKKISAAVRDFMHTPDLIGIVEAEDLGALKKLAERINTDTVAAGKPDPKYEAHILNGNDGRGIDVGFLVKASRVRVLEVKQLGREDKYKNPNTGEDNFVHDRPPLMLRAEIIDPVSKGTFEFTAVVNHLKSYLGFSDPRQMDNVRLKKKLQAEYIARFVGERQKANPTERIIVLGDLNSFQFDDGVLDMVGTMKGRPATKESVLMASADTVDPDLVNLVDMIKVTERYSYNFDGTAQTLDHMLINEAFRKHIAGFGFVRLNADYPDVLRNLDSRVERFSDHDPAVAYFSLDDLTAAKKP